MAKTFSVCCLDAIVFVGKILILKHREMEVFGVREKQMDNLSLCLPHTPPLFLILHFLFLKVND